MPLTFIIDIGLWFSFFFCGIFVWYWSQGDGGIREWVWKFSYNCNFVEHFQKVRCFVAIVFQSVSHIRLFVTPWTAAHQSPLSFTISQSWLKFMSIELVMLANHLILCWLLLLLPSIFPASGSFPVSHLCIRWPKYWNFSISPSNEYSELISFRIDWFHYLYLSLTVPIPLLGLAGGSQSQERFSMEAPGLGELGPVFISLPRWP